MDYKAWPDGVGVLLANEEPAAIDEPPVAAKPPPVAAKPALGPEMYSRDDVKKIIRAQGGKDDRLCTAKTVRHALEASLGLVRNALKPWKADVSSR